VPENAHFFAFKVKNSLEKYIAKLVEASLPPSTVILPPPNTASKFTQLPDNAPLPSNLHRPRKKFQRGISVFTLDAEQLGYINPEELVDPDATPELKPLTLRTTVYSKEFYLSYPDELVRLIPGLNEPRHFSRASPKPYTTWLDVGTGRPTSLDMVRASLPLRVKATIYTNDTLFFHPALMLPDGEALSLVRAMRLLQHTLPWQYEVYLNCFSNFLLWVNCRDKSDTAIGDELSFLSDPGSGCPVYLTTPRSRLQFFHQKGIQRRGRSFSHSPKPGTHGQRSKRLTDYDRWALWYVAQHELKRLPYELNKAQQCEYIAKRWLHWRRPDSLRSHLLHPSYEHIRPDGSTYRITLPSLPEDLSMDHFVRDVTKQLGPSW
jgi:hypothetical protein